MKKLKETLLHFPKKEPVLFAAALCMVISAFFVPPSKAWVEHIDFRTLALLFALMAVVAAMQSHGLFNWIAQAMLTGKKTRRVLFLVLILMPFFTSMLITNDVALITFVPFAILILELTGQQKYMIFIVVAQTVAANMGSMATPVGNPQNLFLYSFFALSAGEFFAAVLPYALLSLIAVAASVLFCPNQEFSVQFPEKQKIDSGKHLVLYLILFVLCLLSVFHVLHWGILLGVVCAALLIADRQLYRGLDYGLLLTFVCFFIYAGNIGAIDSVNSLLGSIMGSSPLLTSALASQVISNVPAAVLLSGFTRDWEALLLGTDIGGLGTPIASMASLISFRLYMKTKDAAAGKYLLWFSVVNFAGLLVFLAVAMLAGFR